MVIKTEAGICPVCGGYDTESDFDWVEDDTVAMYCGCRDCGATWKEYFALVYDGYRQGDNCYDVHGEEI